MRVRPANHDDQEAIVAMNAAMAQETEGLALDLATLRAGVRAVLDDASRGAYRIAEVDGHPAGQLLVTYEWSDWRNRTVWWIQSVYVQPEHRKRGVYRALYASAEADAQAAGAAGIRLYVDARNTRAQAVYAALGMNGDHYRVFEAMFAAPGRPRT